MVEKGSELEKRRKAKRTKRENYVLLSLKFFADRHLDYSGNIGIRTSRDSRDMHAGDVFQVKSSERHLLHVCAPT